MLSGGLRASGFFLTKLYKGYIIMTMKKLLISLLLVVLAAENLKLPEFDCETADQKYLNSIMKPYNVYHKNRIRECIIKYAYIYNHPVCIIANICAAESSFRRTAVSIKGAVGIMQIKPHFWERELYYCKDKKFGKYLNGRTNKINHREYFFWIGLNIEVGCRILRQHFDQYGNYKLALIAYNYGDNSKEFRDCLKGKLNPDDFEYVNKILK